MRKSYVVLSTVAVLALGAGVANLTSCGCTAQKETSVLEFTLTSDGSSYEVSNLNDFTVTSVTVPSTYNGKAVTGIAKKAFSKFDEENNCYFKNTTLKTVTLPDSVIKIGSNSFLNFAELETFNIGNKNFKFVGDDVFCDCGKLNINYPGTKDEWAISTNGSDGWAYKATVKVVCTDGEISYTNGLRNN